MTTEKRTEEQTLTMTATEQPGSEWELAEKNVKKERVEVEYILPNGQTATGWKMVYYHRYKRTLTFSTTYKIWQYAERTVLHKWRREIHSTAVRYSLTKPVGDDHIVGEIGSCLVKRER